MLVTSYDLFIDSAGRRRGRVCRRHDGRWQFVTEHLELTEELSLYWVNDYPPSGLYGDAVEAVAALETALGEAIRLEGLDPCTFDIDVGPYPEPEPTSV